jgi:hypothetical protein
MFILSAFDMAREMLITPKKLDFAREKEDELYKSLMAVAVSKIDEIKELISETIKDISQTVQDEAANFDFASLGQFTFIYFLCRDGGWGVATKNVNHFSNVRSAWCVLYSIIKTKYIFRST